MARRAWSIVKFVAVASLALVASLVLYVMYRHARGIEVCVTNVDGQTLRSVEVSTMGSSTSRHHRVGDLSPSEGACVFVHVEGEASVEVSFTTPGGASNVLVLDGYVEQDNSGSISADITASEARNIRRDIDFF